MGLKFEESQRDGSKHHVLELTTRSDDLNDVGRWESKWVQDLCRRGGVVKRVWEGGDAVSWDLHQVEILPLSAAHVSCEGTARVSTVTTC